MSRLIVCCEKDLASMNIVAALTAGDGWADCGDDGYARYSARGNDVVMCIPDLHIFADGLDRRAEEFGVKVDSVVFPSEHEAASGIPALTVHSVGNFHEAEIGGRAQTLVPPSPAAASDALRLIRRYSRLSSFNICYEATHHGPYLEKPTYFIEIGSSAANWGNLEAASVHARVLSEVPAGNDYPTVIGIGGGHYAPRFTELALSSQVNFGHILPNYQLEGRNDEDIVRMIRMAADVTGTKLAFLHRKSMNGPQVARLVSLGESAGCEFLRSEDFMPLVMN